jgi:hypothetical protein
MVVEGDDLVVLGFQEGLGGFELLIRAGIDQQNGVQRGGSGGKRGSPQGGVAGDVLDQEAIGAGDFGELDAVNFRKRWRRGGLA